MALLCRGPQCLCRKAAREWRESQGQAGSSEQQQWAHNTEHSLNTDNIRPRPLDSLQHSDCNVDTARGTMGASGCCGGNHLARRFVAECLG